MMKRVCAWVLGIFYSLLAISGFGFINHNAPSSPKDIKISSITQNTPLYLEHSGAIHSNPMDLMQSQHYSHSSHYSHESHQSHYSHYSHFSSS